MTMLSLCVCVDDKMMCGPWGRYVRLFNSWVDGGVSPDAAALKAAVERAEKALAKSAQEQVKAK